MSKKPDKSTRYPLDHKPLRNPGESLSAEMERVFDEEVLYYMGNGVLAFALISTEWVRYFFKTPPVPIQMTVVGIVIIGYCVFRVRRLMKKYRALRLGMEGEKFVGQYLESLRGEGSRVFHDIVGKGFNIDHVIVAPQGIYVIETKTYSKPDRGSAKITFDGERVLVNGLKPDRDAIVQVKAGVRWLSNYLHETTGNRYPIKGAIVFPGWYVESNAPGSNDIWVLNHKALPQYIERETIRLKGEDIHLISSRIVMHLDTVEVD